MMDSGYRELYNELATWVKKEIEKEIFEHPTACTPRAGILIDVRDRMEYLEKKWLKTTLTTGVHIHTWIDEKGVLHQVIE